MSFSHQQIEQKWQKYWEEHKSFKTLEGGGRLISMPLICFHIHQEPGFM